MADKAFSKQAAIDKSEAKHPTDELREYQGEKEANDKYQSTLKDFNKTRNAFNKTVKDTFPKKRERKIARSLFFGDKDINDKKYSLDDESQMNKDKSMMDAVMKSLDTEEKYHDAQHKLSELSNKNLPWSDPEWRKAWDEQQKLEERFYLDKDLEGSEYFDHFGERPSWAISRKMYDDRQNQLLKKKQEKFEKNPEKVLDKVNNLSDEFLVDWYNSASDRFKDENGFRPHGMLLSVAIDYLADHFGIPRNHKILDTIADRMNTAAQNDYDKWMKEYGLAREDNQDNDSDEEE